MAQSSKKKVRSRKRSGGRGGGASAAAEGSSSSSPSPSSVAAAGFACDVELGEPDDDAAQRAETTHTPATTPTGGFRVHRRTASGFDGVPDVEYKPRPAGSSDDDDNEKPASDAAETDVGAAPGPGWARVVRRELIGRQGPDPCDFHLRHFEVGPGGYSSFEKHRHIHAIIAECGRGEVWLDGEWVPLSVGDVVYVGPDAAHQLRCPGEADQPFGFFCIVDAVRDRPIVLNEASGT